VGLLPLLLLLLLLLLLHLASKRLVVPISGSLYGNGDPFVSNPCMVTVIPIWKQGHVNPHFHTVIPIGKRG
jgi:hypothetical protein